MSKLLAKVSLPSDFSCSTVTLQLGPEDSLSQVLSKLLQKYGKGTNQEDFVLTHEGVIPLTLNAKSAEVLPSSEVLHFGDQITLFAMEEYTGGEKKCVGAVKTEKGLFGCLPSRSVLHDPSVYRASTFTVLSPPVSEGHTVLRRFTRSSSEGKIDKEAEVDAVCYGVPLVLVDRAGLVWNNKFSPSCVDMRPRGRHGEMFVKFERVSVGGGAGSDVRYGDKFKIVVVQSNRRRTWFNKTLTRMPLKFLPHAGQALSCDGGEEVFFEVREGQGVDSEFWTLDGVRDDKEEENASPHLTPTRGPVADTIFPLELEIPSPNKPPLTTSSSSPSSSYPSSTSSSSCSASSSGSYSPCSSSSSSYMIPTPASLPPLTSVSSPVPFSFSPSSVSSPSLSSLPPSSSASCASSLLHLPSTACLSSCFSPLSSSSSSFFSSAPSSSSSHETTTATKPLGRALRYGDTVLLAGFDSNSSSRDKRLVGAVTTDAGVFACIPVLSVVHDSAIFRASTFTITAPPERTRLFRKVARPGFPVPAGEDEVCYGDVVVLVDRSGLVWNNSSNPQCVDFRPRGTHGEMFVKFEQPSLLVRSNSNGSGSSGSGSSSSHLSAHPPPPPPPPPPHDDCVVRFGDRLKITVHLSNRHRNNYNRTLCTQTIKAAPEAGLALSCDGGAEVDFVLLPMVLISSLRVEVPRSSDPTKYKVVDTRVKVAWGEQVELSYLHRDSRLVFELANHASVTIPVTALSKQGRADFDAVGGVRDATGKSLAVTVAWDSSRERWTVTGKQVSLFVAQCAFLLGSVASFIASWWQNVPWRFVDLVWVLVLLGMTHMASRGKVCFELYTRRTLRSPEWTITPQALTTATAPQVPARFLRAENGDPVKAALRYQTTLRWRRENGIDTILSRPHPKYELIKKHSSAFLHGHDKLGNLVYIDRPGKLDWAALMAAGVTTDDLMHHFRYCMEYKFTVLAPDENAKALTILDMEGVNMGDTRGEKMEFVKKLMAEQSAYCPERTKSLFIINVPFWFGGIWKVISAFLPQRSLDKISIYSKGGYQTKLLELIDAENLPPEYGGTCASAECKVGGCAKTSAMELALLKFVKQGCSTESKKTA